MSVTLLEFVVAGILLIAAWQIGIAIAPWVFQKLRGLKKELDDVAAEAEPKHMAGGNGNHKEEAGSNHKYKNN